MPKYLVKQALLLIAIIITIGLIWYLTILYGIKW
jgi:hypothetical protein